MPEAAPLVRFSHSVDDWPGLQSELLRPAASLQFHQSFCPLGHIHKADQQLKCPHLSPRPEVKRSKVSWPKALPTGPTSGCRRIVYQFSCHQLPLLPFPDSPPPPPICIWSIHCPSPISIRIECVVELIAELRAISNPRCHGIDLNGNCASMSWALIEANWKCNAGELSGQPAKGYVQSFYINIYRFNCIFRRYVCTSQYRLF